METSLIGKAVTTLRLPATYYTGVPIEVVSAQEGDERSRGFKIQIYDERGNINIAPYNYVKLSATNQAGDIMIANGLFASDKEFAYIELTNDMLATQGRLSCNVLFVKRDQYGNEEAILTSRTFYVMVAKTHGGNEDVTEDSSYNILISLLKDVQELSDKMRPDTLDKLGENSVEIDLSDRQKAIFGTIENPIEINENKTIIFAGYTPENDYQKSFLLYIKRTAEVAVTFGNVTKWAYDEIPILPIGAVQKIFIETVDGVNYYGTGGDYFV